MSLHSGPAGRPTGQVGARPTLVVIAGPTASGKTHVAARIAKHFGTAVISADSRQFYRAMRIGTARPAEEELLGVEHHFLGHLDVQETWSAGTFARAAEPVLQQLLQRYGIAVMAGGSGLYIDAVCYGLDPMPASDPAVRERLQERFRQQGLAPLLDELQRLDPEGWNAIDRQNPHRVVRALEVCLISGAPYSAQRKGKEQRTDIDIRWIALDVPRTRLYERIDARVDRMVAEGLVDEARSLLPFRELNALHTVGYRELFEYFDRAAADPGNEQRALDTAIDLIKQHTRNYAKRQVTWLRHGATWEFLSPVDPDAIIRHLGQHDRPMGSR